MPTITFISSIPVFSQDAVDSTPKSFSDIPVLLKHQEKNVQVTLEPHLEGYQSAVQGTLYILTRYGISIFCQLKKLIKYSSVLVFMPDSGSPGFQIEYPAITLHAISRGESGPSIYCQLDETSGDASGLTGGSKETDEDGEGDVPMRELIIVPQQPESRMFHRSIFVHFIVQSHFFLVEIIFEALSQCASLHPDPKEEDEEGDAFLDESAFETFDGSEDQELSEVGRVRSNLINDKRYMPY